MTRERQSKNRALVSYFAAIEESELKEIEISNSCKMVLLKSPEYHHWIAVTWRTTLQWRKEMMLCLAKMYCACIL